MKVERQVSKLDDCAPCTCCLTNATNRQTSRLPRSPSLRSQSLYPKRRLIPQNPVLQPTEEDLAALGLRIAEINVETSTLQTTARTLRTHLIALVSAPSTTALCETVASLQAGKDNLEARLRPLRIGAVKPVDKNERVRVDGEIAKWRDVEGVRKKIAREVWSTIIEGCEKEEVETLKEDWSIEW